MANLQASMVDISPSIMLSDPLPYT